MYANWKQTQKTQNQNKQKKPRQKKPHPSHNIYMCVCVCVCVCCSSCKHNILIGKSLRCEESLRHHEDEITSSQNSRVTPLLPWGRDACKIIASGWVIAMQWLKLIKQITVTCHSLFIASIDCKYFGTRTASPIQKTNPHCWTEAQLKTMQ